MPEDIYTVVADMRKAQMAYFKARRNRTEGLTELAESKRLERKVDELVAAEFERRKNGSDLFENTES